MHRLPSAAIAILCASALLAAIGQVLFKLGATGQSSLAGFVNVRVLIGLGCYGLSTVLWIAALSKGSLTAVYPFTALTFALVYLFGIFYLGETLSTGGMIGIALVLGGLFLISASS